VTDKTGPSLRSIQSASQYLANARPFVSLLAAAFDACWSSFHDQAQRQCSGCWAALNLLVGVLVMLDGSACTSKEQGAKLPAPLRKFIGGDGEEMDFDVELAGLVHVLPNRQWLTLDLLCLIVNSVDAGAING